MFPSRRATQGQDIYGKNDPITPAPQAVLSPQLPQTETTSASPHHELLLTDPDRQASPDTAAPADRHATTSGAPAAKAVDALIRKAVREGASDIHIEPFRDGWRVRLRIDGMLHDLPGGETAMHAAVVSRLKIMADLNIAERRLPQDGRLQLKAGDHDLNLRLSTLPTLYGEKVVLRLLEKERIVRPVEKLGFNPKNLEAFNRLAARPAGMLLVTGPTGCGKTTTLYSLLNRLNTGHRNIVSVEDPVEYYLEGINQVQVHPKIGLSFATALRHILRQDPDIIMLGEIRDLETARIATRAALTGHLVLSTLHTLDAPRALCRLLEMGVESYLVASAVVGVIAQRLIRLVCPSCRREYAPSADEIELFKQLTGQPPRGPLFRGSGCRECYQTGYRGRSAIHEVFTVDSIARERLLSGSAPESMPEAAARQGVMPLLHDGLQRVEMGETTLEEVMRVAADTI